MSDVVEKQDVDISRLFNWGRVFEIVDPNDESVLVPVYIKLLGDADLGRARVYALRKSAELRRKLKDEDSDERIAWIRSEDEMEKPDLINLLVLFSSREISNNAKANVKLPILKAPKSNAKLEKLEKYQKEVDEYPAKKVKAISDAIETEINKFRAELESKPKDELYRMYVKYAVDEFCERQAITAFEDMSTYLACYKDDSYKPENRFFGSFEDFDNQFPETKQLFKDAYRSLDVELPELKKLRRATP